MMTVITSSASIRNWRSEWFMKSKVGKLNKDWNASGPTGGQGRAMEHEREGSVTATCIVGEYQNSGHQFGTDVVFEEDAGDEAEAGAEDATEDAF